MNKIIGEIASQIVAIEYKREQLTKIINAIIDKQKINIRWTNKDSRSIYYEDRIDFNQEEARVLSNGLELLETKLANETELLKAKLCADTMKNNG
jgi:hypothetical protein